MGTDTFLPNGGLPATGTQRSGFPLFSSRLVTLLAAGLALLVLIAILIAAALLPDSGLGTQLDARIQPPSWAHPFGTDTLGRDMLTRTIKGLAVSMRVGMLASIGATLIAIALGGMAGLTGYSLLVSAYQRWAESPARNSSSLTALSRLRAWAATPAPLTLTCVPLVLASGQNTATLAAACFSDSSPELTMPPR